MFILLLAIILVWPQFANARHILQPGLDPAGGQPGECGLAAGVNTTSAPSSLLCVTGTASAVSGSGPWTWSCSGNPAATCSAKVATSASLPLSDAAAAKLVTPVAESISANAAFNNAKPTAAELANVVHDPSMNTAGDSLLFLADGQYTGTTDEILQWAAYKWGLDPNILRASAVDESSWYQNEASDLGSADTVSLGILQITPYDAPGTCTPLLNAPSSVNMTNETSIQNFVAGQPTCLDYNYTAYNADYRAMYMRVCMNKDIPYLGNQSPSAGYPAYQQATGPYLLWGCIGIWHSGNWWDSDAIAYVNRVLTILSDQGWP
jgi:hypothetical protein